MRLRGKILEANTIFEYLSFFDIQIRMIKNTDDNSNKKLSNATKITNTSSKMFTKIKVQSGKTLIFL